MHCFVDSLSCTALETVPDFSDALLLAITDGDRLQFASISRFLALTSLVPPVLCTLLFLITGSIHLFLENYRFLFDFTLDALGTSHKWALPHCYARQTKAGG